jgi:hypothetical protein
MDYSRFAAVALLRGTAEQFSRYPERCFELKNTAIAGSLLLCPYRSSCFTPERTTHIMVQYLLLDNASKYVSEW